MLLQTYKEGFLCQTRESDICMITNARLHAKQLKNDKYNVI